MEIDQLRQLLELVSQGNLSVEAAQKELAAQGGVRVLSLIHI